jgi:hypothetical protein
MVNEARLEELEAGLTPVTDGWFVVSIPKAAWVTNEVLGDACIFEGDDVVRRGLRALPKVAARAAWQLERFALGLLVPRGGGFQQLRHVYTGSHGPLAQLVEQGTFNPKVAGSNPARPIKRQLYSAKPHGSVSRSCRTRRFGEVLRSPVRSSGFRQFCKRFARSLRT